MLLLRQGASGIWVDLRYKFWIHSLLQISMQRLQNTPFVAKVTNTLQRKWCAKHFVRTQYALVTVKDKLT